MASPRATPILTSGYGIPQSHLNIDIMPWDAPEPQGSGYGIPQSHPNTDIRPWDPPQLIPALAQGHGVPQSRTQHRHQATGTPRVTPCSGTVGSHRAGTTLWGPQGPSLALANPSWHHLGLPESPSTVGFPTASASLAPRGPPGLSQHCHHPLGTPESHPWHQEATKSHLPGKCP